jgi:holliday junction DNA helicase RuvA
MIATLTGEVSDKLLDRVVIDVNGVGYGVFVTSVDSENLSPGAIVKVFIYEHVREQAHDLFGFLDRDTQKLFEQLLEVNGVGPKMALNVLSIGMANNVRQAIAGGDVKYIQQASGVGKRVAERIVVDLKDKVGLASIDIADSGLLIGGSVAATDEAVEALIALGFSAPDAVKALKNVSPDLATEERVKAALKGASI